jgi:uncharacterized protein
MSCRDLAQFILMVGLLFTCHAWASSTLDLYAVSVPVTACHQNSPSQKAILQAYRTVMVRVSGNTHVNTIPAVYHEQDKATDFVSRYSCASTDHGATKTLQVTFEKEPILQVLHDAGQSLWLAQRPVVQVWMAAQHKDSATVVTDSDMPGLSDAVQQVVSDRGLRVSFPLMDLTDRASVTPSDIWQLRQQAIWHASERYGHDDILMGVVYVDDDAAMEPWHGIWYWRPSQADVRQVVHFETKGSSAEQATKAAVNWLADQLANEGGYLNEQGSVVTLALRIDGVQNLDQYQAVLQYLNKRGVIKKLSVDALQDSQMLLQVDVAGGQWALRQALSSNRHLILQDTVTSPAALNYRWVPVVGGHARAQGGR